MDDSYSLITWWRTKRSEERQYLLQKSKTEPLSDVEMMILNPFSLGQARTQVKMLNGSKVTDPTCSEQGKL